MKKPSLLRTEKVPKGWFAREDLEKKWNCSTAHTLHLLSAAIKKGLVEKQKFMVVRHDRIYPVPHYREKK
jgi:hypothetical protein